MEMNNVSENIKRLRLASGLTQEDLAGKMGIPRQSIQRWEAGVYTPGLKNLLKLATALGIGISDLTEEV